MLIVTRTKRHILWFVVMLTMLGLPSLISAAYINIGNHALVVAQTSSGRQPAILTASNSLVQAKKWNASNPRTYQRLAQIYMLRDKPQWAATTLEQAYYLQPENQWIQRELAEAYEISGQKTRADALYARLGTTPNQMKDIGDTYLQRHKYIQAFVWYSSALRQEPSMYVDTAFKRAVTATIVGDYKALELLKALEAQDGLNIHTLYDTLTIYGTSLLWMDDVGQVTYGVPLDLSNNRDEPVIGFLWWTGEVLGIFNAAQGGVYNFSATVLHNTPPPVEMAIGLDGQQLRLISLERGDNSWETFTISADIGPGPHTVHIWFLNDGVVGGKNRNAAIKSITIERAR